MIKKEFNCKCGHSSNTVRKIVYSGHDYISINSKGIRTGGHLKEWTPYTSDEIFCELCLISLGTLNIIKEEE